MKSENPGTGNTEQGEKITCGGSPPPPCKGGWGDLPTWGHICHSEEPQATKNLGLKTNPGSSPPI